MIIQVIIRLTLYLDQAIIRNGQEIGFNKSRFGIDNTVSNNLYGINIIFNNLTKAKFHI